MRRHVLIFSLALGLVTACTGQDARPAPIPSPRRSSSVPVPASATPTETISESSPAPPAESDAVYPWGPNARDRLDVRFAAPPGFARVPTEKGTFGAFLRTLPLLPEDAPVVDYRGRKLYSEGRHEGIASVVDLDVGSKDLQHCADVVIRLHAEWRYGRGERDIAYRSVSGTPIPYRRYLAGERAVLTGDTLAMRGGSGPQADAHGFFRGYLDDVFSWAGTASLERDAKKVAFADLRPGDFFVMSGNPFGHAVIILDVARGEGDRLALLLGQSYMPAQSFHVLRPLGSGVAGAKGDKTKTGAWFVVEPGEAMVDTPFWKPFPLSALRRL